MSGGIRLGIYEKALIDTGDWNALFRQVRLGGFDFVDLSIDETPERAARLEWDEHQCRLVRDAAAANGVQIGGLCLSLHRSIMPGSHDAAMRAKAAAVYRKGIDLAVRLGVSVVQVAGYFAFYEDRHPHARQWYVETLLGAVPYAARAGVVLAIENVDGEDIASVQDAMAVVHQAASPWVQVYPDVGNIAEHGGDAALELRAAAGHMVALHVKDVLPGQPRRIPFGSGIADFDSAFAELAQQGWSGRIMLEMWNDNAPDSAQLCSAAREFVQRRLEQAGLQIVTERTEHAAS